jgi:hypothetical protein
MSARARIDQVTGDSELSPLAFKLAFAIEQRADPVTLASPVAARALTKATGTTEQILQDLLAELAARGHIAIEPAGGRAAGRLRLHFKGAARPQTSGERAELHISPFPLARRRTMVLKLATLKWPPGGLPQPKGISSNNSIGRQRR